MQRINPSRRQAGIYYYLTACFKPSIFIATLILLFACTKDDQKIQEEDATFGIKAAREYFMNNAKDLRVVNFSPSDVKSIDYGERLVPNWSQYRYRAGEVCNTYAIPIENTGYSAGAIVKKQLSSDPNITISQVRTELIIQKSNIKDTLRQFVATFIGIDSDKRKMRAETAFSFLGNRSTFTGYMIMSTLEGNLTGIYLYQNGKRTMLHQYAVVGSTAEVKEGQIGFAFYKGHAHSTKGGGASSGSGDYGNGEYGVCERCGFAGIVYISYGLCLKCINVYLDEIIVTPDPEDVCTYCGQKPCICPHYLPCGCLEGHCICENNPFACRFCGQDGCNGECQDGKGENGSGDGNESSQNNKIPTVEKIQSIITNNITDSRARKVMQTLLNCNNEKLRALFSNTVIGQIRINLVQTSNNSMPIAYSLVSPNNALMGDSPVTIYFNTNYIARTSVPMNGLIQERMNILQNICLMIWRKLYRQ